MPRAVAPAALQVRPGWPRSGCSFVGLAQHAIALEVWTGQGSRPHRAVGATARTRSRQTVRYRRSGRETRSGADRAISSPAGPQTCRCDVRYRECRAPEAGHDPHRRASKPQCRRARPEPVGPVAQAHPASPAEKARLVRVSLPGLRPPRVIRRSALQPACRRAPQIVPGLARCGVGAGRCSERRLERRSTCTAPGLGKLASPHRPNPSTPPQRLPGTRFGRGLRARTG